MADYASASHLGGPSPALFSLPSPESLRVAWLRAGGRAGSEGGVCAHHWHLQAREDF